MRKRYEISNPSKELFLEPTPKSQDKINIQIFNISARNRKVLTPFSPRISTQSERTKHHSQWTTQ